MGGDSGPSFRKKKKSGAADSHARIAERLLAAQLRREALNHANRLVMFWCYWTMKSVQQDQYYYSVNFKYKERDTNLLNSLVQNHLERVNPRLS